MFHQAAVFNAGGAGGFAAAAVQAFVDVLDEGIADSRAIQLDLDHLVDAAARGVGFHIPEAIGRAGVQADAAVDTPSIVFVDGSVSRAGRGGHESLERGKGDEMGRVSPGIHF
jgi:hypothetical protein